MEKVGVYCRLSDEDRYKKNKSDDSESIANQKSMLLKYALERNWEVVDIYSDDDYSGAGTYRPDFERMIKDCESGRINIVLCKTQSRFSRDMEVVEKYLHNKFIEWGVRFISIVDNADTDNKFNKKSRQINGLINEWYLEDLSDNIRHSLKNKREDGLFMGSFAPYGYQRDPEDKHHLIIDENVADIVREIFEKYKNGISYNHICKSLNERGILNPSAYKESIGSKFVCCRYDYSITGKWNSDTIARILRQEVYIGNLVQGKTTYISYKNHKEKAVPREDWCRVENTHEAIIDKELWYSVQKRLGTNEKGSKNGKIHIFSQKVYCSCCGKIFSKNNYSSYTVNGVSVYKAYLQCKGRKKYNICDNSSAIRIEVLEEYVLKAINDLLKKCNKAMLKDGLESAFNRENKNYNKMNSLNKEKAELEKKLQQSKEYFKNLYQDKSNGVITEEDFKMLRQGYYNDVENYEKRLEAIRKEMLDTEERKTNTKDIESILKKYKKVDKLTKVIVDEFIDKIYIGKLNKETKTREIKIVWNLDL